MEFEAVIGFEVHAQLATATKIFCSCASAGEAPPNTRVCPVCLGLPGALPVLNRRAVGLALRAAVALEADISPLSGFDRKNYFYPDLPKGYQITQTRMPLARGGHVDIGRDGDSRRIGLQQIHIEEDAGKTIHDASGVSLVDMNRCGVPLLEIVTLPDVRGPREAVRFLTELRRILVFAGVTAGDMHRGHLRFDTNVSVRPRGSGDLGTRTEIKNLNSFRAAKNAITYEIERQSALVSEGKTVTHETLLWDDGPGRAVAMRTKEGASDYRYFPEPDLVDFAVDDEWIGRVRDAMPELPGAMERRFVSTYGLSEYDAGVLTAEPDVALYFDDAVKALDRGEGGGEGEGALRALAKSASNWVMVVVGGYLNAEGLDVGALRARGMTPARLAEILTLRLRGEVNEPAARRLFGEAARSDEPIGAIVERLGLAQLDDDTEIRAIVADVLDRHAEEVRRYRAGERKLLRYFVGEVMRATAGRADPALATRLITERLDAPG